MRAPVRITHCQCRANRLCCSVSHCQRRYAGTRTAGHFAIAASIVNRLERRDDGTGGLPFCAIAANHLY
jgi:hypothetical protein